MEKCEKKNKNLIKVNLVLPCLVYINSRDAYEVKPME